MEPKTPCPLNVVLLNEHWGSPIIIDNPAAEFDLLPENHTSYLEEVQGSHGRDWNLYERNSFVSIRICVDDFLQPESGPLSPTGPVTIFFDDTNPHPPTKDVGSVSIEWTDTGQKGPRVHFRSTAGQNGHVSWSRKPVKPGVRDGLLCAGNRKYEISAVTFTDPQGTVHKFVRPAGSQKMRVIIEVDPTEPQSRATNT